MQMTFTIDIPDKALADLIESVARRVLELPVKSAVAEQAAPEAEAATEAAPEEDIEVVEQAAPEPEATNAPEALPEDFNVLIAARDWSLAGEDPDVRRRWLKNKLSAMGVESLAKLTTEQLPQFVEAMNNAAC